VTAILASYHCPDAASRCHAFLASLASPPAKLPRPIAAAAATLSATVSAASTASPLVAVDCGVGSITGFPKRVQFLSYVSPYDVTSLGSTGGGHQHDHIQTPKRGRGQRGQLIVSEVEPR